MPRPFLNPSRVTLQVRQGRVSIRQHGRSQPIISIERAKGQSTRKLLSIGLGKGITPISFDAQITKREFEQIRPHLLNTLNQLAQKIPPRFGMKTYERLSRRTNAPLPIKPLHRHFVVRSGLRIVVPIKAKVVVEFFDGLAAESKSAEEQRIWKRVEQVARVAREIARTYPFRYDPTKPPQNQGINMSRFMGYLFEKRFVMRNPPFLAFVLRRVFPKRRAEELLDVMKMLGHPSRHEKDQKEYDKRKMALQRAYHQSLARITGRETPRLQYFVRKRRSSSAPFATYDFFPEPMSSAERDRWNKKHAAERKRIWLERHAERKRRREEEYEMAESEMAEKDLRETGETDPDAPF